MMDTECIFFVLIAVEDGIRPSSAIAVMSSYELRMLHSS